MVEISPENSWLTRVCTDLATSLSPFLTAVSLLSFGNSTSMVSGETMAGDKNLEVHDVRFSI